jgi:hypothetical protein
VYVVDGVNPVSENELVVGVPTFWPFLYTLYVAASLIVVHCRFIVVVLTVVTAKPVTWAGAKVSTVKVQGLVIEFLRVSVAVKDT